MKGNVNLNAGGNVDGRTKAAVGGKGRNKGKWFYYLALFALALAAPYFLAPTQDGADAAEPPATTEGAAPASEGAAPASDPETLAPPDQPAPREQAPAAQDARRAPKAQPERRVERLETDDYVAEIVNLNGGLLSFQLKDEKYRTNGSPIDVVTTDKDAFLPLAIEVDGVPEGAVFETEQSSPRELRLTYTGDGLRVVRKLTAGADPYQLWLTTRIENIGPEPRKARLRLSTYHYVERAATEGGIPLLPVRSPAMSNALCRAGDELMRENHSALYDERSFDDAFWGLELGGPVAFAAVENVYFVSAIAPSGTQKAKACRIASSPRGGVSREEAVGDLFAARIRYPEITLQAGESQSYRTLAYLGPKTPVPLSQAGHSLKEAIETGWFTVLAEALTWLLRQIHDLVGNWGLAIIALTFLVKLLLYPLTAKQMQSMARMKELKPELDAINERFADDREKKGAAMMELYRSKGVNPAAGCFPVLLQLPIWFSLYTSLATNVELFHAHFALWWTDLSSPDPYFSLPLALGVLMFLQQKMSPATGMDPLQQKMMLYMMPTMITAFMLFLPVGLCLYMFTNSALSIVQQRVIEARLAKLTPGREEKSDDKDPPPTDSPPSPAAHSPSSPAAAPQPGVAAKARPKSSRPSKAERRSRRGK